MKHSIKELLDKPVWIWGASNAGVPIAKALKDNKANIRGFVDNNPSLHENIVFGYKVFLPTDFFSKLSADDIVLLCCTSKNNSKIRKQLGENGIESNIREIDEFSFDRTVQHWGSFIEEGYEPRIISRCCTKRDFDEKWFADIRSELYSSSNGLTRKEWEYVYIIKALEDGGMLKLGKKGIGFAVGEEPLPSFFASHGVEILATDLDCANEQAKAWMETGQNAGGEIEKLWNKELVSREDFYKMVSFRNVDMNEIPEDIGQFDFCWSSCAIEHVGSLELSKLFMKNMLSVIKPGGMAVHTTEFNLWSNEDTEEEGTSVIYRKRDLEELREWFLSQGCEMELSFKRENGEYDRFLPFPHYYPSDTRNHLNLMIGPYASTSFALIIRKY